MRTLFTALILVVAAGPSYAADTEAMMKARCEDKWPADFRMQEYCLERQLESYHRFYELEREYDREEVWSQIQHHCVSKWLGEERVGLNWVMLAYCIEQQIESAKRLGKIQ